MLNTNIDQSSKAFMRNLVRPIHSIKNAYKYLTFESGKLMLEKHNIQFTRASRLNDWLDCNIDIVNYDEVIALYGTIISRDEFERIKKEGKEFADSLGICSLGQTPYNKELWKRYACSSEGIENGICIELDFQSIIEHFTHSGKSKYGFVSLFVTYQDKVVGTINWMDYLKGGKNRLEFFSKLVTTKIANSEDNWQKEAEIRFILMEGIGDKEYFREVLPIECITRIYLGKDISENEYQLIKRIIKNQGFDIPVHINI